LFLAHLLKPENSSCAATELAASRYSLSASPAGDLIVSASARTGAFARLLHDDRDDRWILFAEPDLNLRRNGEPVSTGIAILDHRDEFCLAGARFYFSSEARPRVEPYAGVDSPRCPRCARPVETGQEAVRCPGCGVVHHELADPGRCWSYSLRCAVCEASTDLAGGLTWIPGDCR
jgi:hypothetical protein